MGRDILTRIIYGSRVSLTVGLLVVFLSGTMEVILSLISGYVGGLVDDTVMRFADICLAFPIILAIGGWVGYARITRGQMLAVREKEYIDAAQVDKALAEWLPASE